MLPRLNPMPTALRRTPQRGWPLLWLAWLCWLCGAALPWAALAQTGPLPAQRTPALLADSAGSVALWPAVTLWADASGQATLEQALARLSAFETPQASATLGVRQDAVWLHASLAVDPASAGRWTLDINHPDLNRIDVYVLQADRVLRHVALGTDIPRAERPLPARTPAVALELLPGQRYALLLRVQTRGAMILPITLNTPPAMLERALNEHILQGVLAGLALCLILYSLAQWMSLREPLFLQYALMTSGSLLYSLHFFGIGQQYLWGHSPWLTDHAVGLSSFMALAGSFLFMSQAVAGDAPQSRFLRLMRRGAVGAAVLGLAHALDLLSLKQVATIVSILGPMPALLSLPGALRRARAGDPIGTTLLVAWLVYAGGAATIIGVINGAIPVNFWSLHSFQISATVDMLLFMRVLGLRTQALREAALHARQERDALHSLAHSDALTGLPNRRALQAALASALAHADAGNLLGVYILDLDGFKPVNDLYGHDVGDELLVAVTHRLRSTLRQTDLIARLGGDEFVVVTERLLSPQQAHDLGQKLLDAFHAPFALGSVQIQVGLTIGYAIAPDDGMDAATLLKRADAAMYSGKQSGKFCLRRNRGDLALSSA